jgi:undecaprenyl phosphate N,N'-diacetylbacillosamine 1-phosphate transferase
LRISPDMSIYKNFLKPLLDYFIGLNLFIFFLPLMLSLAIALIFINKGKIFFVQQRAGKNGKYFYLLKFKTLRDIFDANGKLLPDTGRQYAFGNALRHLHLDELPQLINVLQGELSLIGPRPLLISYLPLYTERQQKRHDVKPGLVGLAQVLGGNTLSWHQRLRLDTFYVQKNSWQMDLRIVLLALSYFLKKKSGHSQSSLFSESFVDYYNRNLTVASGRQ